MSQKSSVPKTKNGTHQRSISFTQLKTNKILPPVHNKAARSVGSISSISSQGPQKSKDNTSIRESNSIRSLKIYPLLDQLEVIGKQFLKEENFVDVESIIRCRNLHLEAAEVFSQIFGFYNLEVVNITNEMVDSAVHIMPANYSVKFFDSLKYISHAITIFPHSLYQKLGANKLRLCEDIKLLKPEYEDIYKLKLLGGLISANKIQSKSSATNYIIYMIVYYLNQNIPEMTEEWIINFPPSSKKKISKLSVTIIEDQVQALKGLIKYYSSKQKLEDKVLVEKVKKMKGYLDMVDPDRFAIEYWECQQFLL